MATVKGPLFSIDASGTVGGAIVYSSWKGRSYVRQHAVPANPKSVGQLSVRAMMKFLSQDWTNLSTVQKAVWETRAAVTNISPFNAFLGYNMTRWGLYKTPSIADPAAESNTAGVIDTPVATAGSRSILISLDVDTLNDNWGALIYRSDSTPVNPTRNNMVQVVKADAAETYTWLDFPLTPGTIQYYQIKSFSDDGVIGSGPSIISATPTA